MKQNYATCIVCGRYFYSGGRQINKCSKACKEIIISPKDRSSYTHEYHVNRNKHNKIAKDTLREIIISYFDYECSWCGEESDKLEVHHKIPLSKGGRNHMTNIEIVCKSCHHFLTHGLVIELTSALNPKVESDPKNR